MSENVEYDGTPVVSIDGLTRLFGKVTALDDPMFSFGHFLKSTSLRTKVAVAQQFPWFGTLRARGELAAADADGGHLSVAVVAVVRAEALLLDREPGLASRYDRESESTAGVGLGGARVEVACDSRAGHGPIALVPHGPRDLSEARKRDLDDDLTVRSRRHEDEHLAARFRLRLRLDPQIPRRDGDGAEPTLPVRDDLDRLGGVAGPQLDGHTDRRPAGGVGDPSADAPDAGRLPIWSEADPGTDALLSGKFVLYPMLFGPVALGRDADPEIGPDLLRGSLPPIPGARRRQRDPELPQLVGDRPGTGRRPHHLDPSARYRRMGVGVQDVPHRGPRAEVGPDVEIEVLRAAVAKIGYSIEEIGDGEDRVPVTERYAQEVRDQRRNFIGAASLLALYLLVLLFVTYMALRCRSTFPRLVAAGMGLCLFTYVFINVAMVTGLVPVVGVPLPLVSYGGTSMLTITF